MNLLGIDLGTKKLGLSLGSSLSGETRPLMMVSYKSDEFVLNQIKKLCIEWRVQKIIVGDPGIFENNKAINEFLKKFEETVLMKMQIPFERWSEQGTSQEAQSLMRDYPLQSRDSIAAMLMLSSYLRHQNHGQ
jgi:putative Holliday junction resolvase